MADERIRVFISHSSRVRASLTPLVDPSASAFQSPTRRHERGGLAALSRHHPQPLTLGSLADGVIVERSGFSRRRGET